MLSKYNFLFLLLAIALGFTACEEEQFDPVLRLGEAASITSPAAASAFTISEGTEGDELAMFSWTAADFGVTTEVIYSLEADLAGANFAEPEILVPATTTTSASVSNGILNNFLIGRGIAGGTAQDVELRVKAVVGREEDGNVLTSSPLMLSVTPFEAEVTYPAIYVPGAHQGWDPPSAPNIYSVESNGAYEGFVFFADANNEFKFTEGPSWDANYGDTGADGTLDSDGDNLMAIDPGFHLLRADLNDLTYTVQKTDWGIIGDATSTGWDSDTDLTYDAASNTLSITLDLGAGEIKFRANDAWDINLGDTAADGSMEFNGDNIAVAEAGNYTVTLELNKAVYGYSLTKN